MFFWKKEASKEILKSLKNIEKNLKNLKSYADKKDKSLDIVNGITANIENAKKEILERTNEEKEKPWIDQKYDSEIDKFSKEEIKFLDNLEKELAATYLPLLEENSSEEDFTYALNELLNKFENEEKEISAREQKNEQKIKEFIRLTLAERLSHPFTPAGANRTNDGVSWGDIVYVVRQLGGWTAIGGRHQIVIVFPKSTQNIPISRDVNSGVIAKEILEQLPNWFPEHKIRNLNENKLKTALRAGDLLRAA